MDILYTNIRNTLGLPDIKPPERNGVVIGICRVRDEDEVMMITAKGQIQRIAVKDVHETSDDAGSPNAALH